jgi:hypothetical protein
MKFAIMDQTGHSTLEFDKADPAQLAAAHAKFDELVAEKKFTAAERIAPGESRRVKSFDPDAGEMVFVPPLVGG